MREVVETAAPVAMLELAGTAALLETPEIVGTAAPVETAIKGILVAIVAAGVTAIGVPAMVALSAMGAAINAKETGVVRAAAPGNKINVHGHKMAVATSAMAMAVPMVAMAGVAATMAGMDAHRISISHHLKNQGIREELGKNGQTGLLLLVVTNGPRTNSGKLIALLSG